MAATAVIGLSAGKRLLSSSVYYSDYAEKFCSSSDIGFPHHQVTSSKNVISAKKSSYSSNFLSKRDNRSVKALKEHVDTASIPSDLEPWFQSSKNLEVEISDFDCSVDALLLLQKSMLEKQWNLSPEETLRTPTTREKNRKKIQVTGSGISARRRRIDTRRRALNQRSPQIELNTRKQQASVISPKLLQNHMRGYLKGALREELLSHTEVIHLSKKIRTGLHIEDRKSRLEERLGYEPSEEQLSASLNISRAELQSTLIECSLAREKLAMSNVRLVMSIAQRYENKGAEMADLVQGGLIGLLRGIEKFDSSKGFKISTYVYWWIRQGVSRTLVENSRTLRLPTYLHERLGLIRNAKTKLDERGITPSVANIAECLNMSQKKVRNATEAVNRVYSLDREAFPSLNGLPGYTLHNYIADNRPENIPWHGVDEWALKDEVNKLMNTTLRERERDIIRLYYGLDNETLTWEDISRRIGLSRERVRQVGLVALEKLKHAARRKRLEAMLVKQ
ncbi:hypothetical protein DCAR_0625966 [Daucus carota subsp. sativus]|uniref:RNA polymerase sigma-70 domain-containing protein n=1 Tax=Daucus carota subsp. sativus TaxID=79200 RepID=A0AAF0XEM9_DAUCS|nr:PREDICTED: RNA polymerase sigma factor sigA [Daucus carota subsp. sativus]WOH06538.1 hypothetical protein DCAR_0625966 [Daucus carota subsp. sativus]